MGTNYYLQVDVCDKCGKCAEELHIGKSPYGWCFYLHVEPESGIHDLPDWECRWSEPGTRIVDEYGTELNVGQMRDVITVRSGREWPEHKWIGYKNEADFHASNYSERGPFGLIRFKVGGPCIKHGAGTWDCMVGEFS